MAGCGGLLVVWGLIDSGEISCGIRSKRHNKVYSVINAHPLLHPGSSLLVQLTNLLALDALRVAGLTRMTKCAVLPLATGMAMTLTLLTLQADRRRQQEQQQGGTGESWHVLAISNHV